MVMAVTLPIFAALLAWMAGGAAAGAAAPPRWQNITIWHVHPSSNRHGDLANSECAPRFCNSVRTVP
eukprot:SAG22_NODE_16708_length_319_cov_1.563636_1_plen_66_part_01